MARKAAMSAARRVKESYERRKAEGFVQLRFELYEEERDALPEIAQSKGYATVKDYIADLVRRDIKRHQAK